MKRVYRHLSEPEQYPAFTRRSAKAVTRKALQGKIQFTSLRGFPTVSDGGRTRLTEIRETIEMYEDHFHLGKVLWPVYPTLLTENFHDLVDICKEKGLYLYDFWGYVPGSHPVKEIWGEYIIPEDADAYMRSQLGDRFLGYDNGEQDGRYVHALANRCAPLLPSRQAQYKNFQAYFEKLNDAMRNNTVTLASLTFLHYFAREGNTIMLGAETAQALPCSAMWFAFIRGAAKQYGLLYYGNASVWNRWGYKDYHWEETDTSQGFEAGRFAGTSLSLLRRLIYNQYMYNCDILGFESSWFTSSPAAPGSQSDAAHYIMGDTEYTLTPIGVLQQQCRAFVERHGFPGVLYTPLAIVTDFHAGWMPPRHLYTRDIYKVWGNLPYRVGDHQLDCLFSLLFPHYERAGFYRNEAGFLTETPYGEIADLLLSDVSGAVLQRYSAAIVVNDTPIDYEFFLKLKTFAAQGGKLLVFRGLAEAGRKTAVWDADYDAFFGIGSLPQGPITEIPWGKGSVTIIEEHDGLTPTGQTTYANEENGDIPRPYAFSPTAQDALDAFLRTLSILKANNPALQYCVDVKDAENYTFFAANNTCAMQAFDLEACEGEIVEIQELPIEDGIKELPEFLPAGTQADPHPHGSGSFTILPGDCRLFSVKTCGITLEELPDLYPAPPHTPLFLSLPTGSGSAKDYLLEHPTFSQHFCGLLLPASYLEARSEEAAAKEAHYFRLQGISVAVDFTPLLNHYPDIAIIGNIPSRSREAVERVERTLRLAAAYDCSFAVFTGTRNAENEWTPQQALDGSLETLRAFREIGQRYGIPCYLQNRVLDIPAEEQYRLGAMAGMGKALHTAFARCEGWTYSGAGEELLLLAAAQQDCFGQWYKMQLPCAGCPDENRRNALRQAYREACARGIPIVLAGDFASWDEVTAELAFLG